MAKKKIIAIATSDWHLHPFEAFSDQGNRLDIALKAGEYIANKAAKYKVPILFCGDLFHNPKSIDNETHSKVHNWYKRVIEGRGITFYAISGNHDMSQKNTSNHKSPSHLWAFKVYPTFRLLDNESWAQGNLLIFGIPYFNYEKDWLEEIRAMNEQLKTYDKKAYKGVKKILLLHGNAPGAKSTTGHEIDSIMPKHLDRFFKGWDLVLFGHIHKPQKLSKKSYMLGSPIQQNWGDEGNEMGYWLVYSDLTMKFKPLNDLFPEFLTLNKKQYADYERVNHKSVQDFIAIMDDKGIESESDGVQAPDSFGADKSRSALAKAYCQEKGITDKTKIKALIKALEL